MQHVCGGEKRRIHGFGAEAWRKKTAWKTQKSMGGKVKFTLKQTMKAKRMNEGIALLFL